MPMDTRNIDKHVPSDAYGLEKRLIIRNQHFMKKKFGTLGNA